MPGDRSADYEASIAAEHDPAVQLEYTDRGKLNPVAGAETYLGTLVAFDEIIDGQGSLRRNLDRLDDNLVYYKKSGAPMPTDRPRPTGQSRQNHGRERRRASVTAGKIANLLRWPRLNVYANPWGVSVSQRSPYDDNSAF